MQVKGMNWYRRLDGGGRGTGETNRNMAHNSNILPVQKIPCSQASVVARTGSSPYATNS
jgi:hypothetical protein